MLYVYIKDENTLITHDGNVQLGIVHMTIDEFLSMAKVKYEVSYWLPDPYGIRYKQLNFQNHLFFQNLWHQLSNEKEKK